MAVRQIDVKTKVKMGQAEPRGTVYERLSPWAKKLIMLAYDAATINLVVIFGLLLRFDNDVPWSYFQRYFVVALPYTLVSLVAFYFLGLYHSIWEYASVDEALAAVKGALASTVALGMLLYLPPSQGFPRSVVLMALFLNFLVLAGGRMSIRIARRLQVMADMHDFRDPKRVIIVGAGQAGAMTLRELQRHPELGYRPVGFVDDDPHKRGLRINGIPVLGTTDGLKAAAQRLACNEVIVAMPAAGSGPVRRVVQECATLGVKIKTLPGVYELIDGKVTVNQIRDVSLEDLLGRDPVRVNIGEIAAYLEGERVLVTGAGGSIGSELCRQIARRRPQSLLMLDNHENGVYELGLELAGRAPAERCADGRPDSSENTLKRTVIIADIRDRDKIESIFETFRPTVVFHAAAHKHVPLMEAYPEEAIKTNVYGTRNVADMAAQYGAKRFVLISTDKAVNPKSVMGATKRMAEMIIQSYNGSTQCRFVAVRFGNVLGSAGSVVPIFKAQISRGGPVTVTHPEMTRYFMTIPEAVSLVLQAGSMGQGGEVFVLDMGKPVSIDELARQLITLSGFVPDRDIQVTYIGVRPGEKLREELLTGEEGQMATRHDRIFVAKGRQSRFDLGNLLHADGSTQDSLRLLNVVAGLPMQQHSSRIASGNTES
ncbi:MAG: polysaccharide biosynthesis protein [Bacillota bacterium]